MLGEVLEEQKAWSQSVLGVYENPIWPMDHSLARSDATKRSNLPLVKYQNRPFDSFGTE